MRKISLCLLAVCLVALTAAPLGATSLVFTGSGSGTMTDLGGGNVSGSGFPITTLDSVLLSTSTFLNFNTQTGDLEIVGLVTGKNGKFNPQFCPGDNCMISINGPDSAWLDASFFATLGLPDPNSWTFTGLGVGTDSYAITLSQVNAVPEPGTIFLLGSGLAVASRFARRRLAKLRK